MDKNSRSPNSSSPTRRPIAAAPAAPVDQERIQAAVREILIAVGEDPDREGLVETPERVARMYAEMFAGLHEDPRLHLNKTFTQKHNELVLVKDIEFSSMCEHHLLPFVGKAHVAYLPNGKVAGLSKLARVVDSLARRGVGTTPEFGSVPSLYPLVESLQGRLSRGGRGSCRAEASGNMTFFPTGSAGASPSLS